MTRMALFLVVALSPPIYADEPANDGKTIAMPIPEERQVKSRHQIRIGEQAVAYEATAGTMLLKNDAGNATGSIFYTAYVRTGVGKTGLRPISFIFNGGPGSSSVWLHLGAYGPRRVSFDDAEQPAPAPYQVVDNHASILDISDLVFIDPVNTGFSQVAGEGEAKDFLGVEEDVKAVGEFIRLYVTRNQRWNSPKFLAGESYGTTRAAALVNHLQGKGIFFNGVMLVSSILNFQTARFEAGNDLPYITFLPTYAATAWYHNALPERAEDLGAFLARVRQFAQGDYAQALMKGSRLSAAERAEIAGRLSEMIGLDTDYIEQANLRISIFRFTKELLRDRRRTAGRLDSRYTGIDADAAGERFQHDPSYTAILGPYTAALNAYVRGELGYQEDREYQILSGKVNRAWNWEVPNRTGYVNVAEDLREAISKNPHLKIFVANGYYDLATPFFATEYTMDHLGLEADLQNNIEMHYYEAGHMMYIHPPSLDKLKADTTAFIRAALR